MKRRSFFNFPNPINEVSARFTAAGVVALCAAILLSRQMWLLVPLAYGFWARALTGPTLSPLGQVARIAATRLPIAPHPVPGPPKRFAQAIGAALSTAAAGFALLGLAPAAVIAVGAILVAATLESALGFCLGCEIFKVLMRARVIPKSVCEECANIWSRRPA